MVIIIILIVYLPLFALVGIEGKMFKPMAQTVAFAILGAFILSLTYIPMMSALFLSKKTAHKKNISDIIIVFCQKLYAPMLNWALRWKKTIVLATNQGLIYVLAVVVIGGFVGAGGLGYLVIAGNSKPELQGKGLIAGVAILLLGVIFDRIMQAGARRSS